MGYMIVEKDTGNIKSLVSWNNSESSSSNYPVDEGCYMLKVDEKLFNTVRKRFLEINYLRIKNENSTTYNEMIEELVDIKDIETEISDLKEYLASTDFYYLRQMETGEVVKGEIVSKRKQARNRLRELGL